MSLSRSAPHARPRWLALMIVISLTMFIAVPISLAALTGTNFDTEDGNLKNDPAPPETDWVDVTEIRRSDAPTGSGDDSFTQGTKEDTADPVTEFGSIPPNKSDLLTFGIYTEETASGKFLHMYWTRVQEPNGTTNMDFEFNQNKCDPDDVAGSICATNDVTPVRLAGDLLITYELSRGGTQPHLFLLEWLTEAAPGDACDASNSFPCWGNRVDLSGLGAATGSINQVAIPSGESDGLGALSARTFGEASVDLDLVFDENTCTSFGSAYLKSRSSDSFTSALKDYIAPEPVNITNCGSVIIRKETDPDEATPSTVFGYTKTFATDPTSANTFTLMDDGSKPFTGVLFGTSLTVTEDVVPAGWDLSNIDCSASTGVTATFSGTDGTDTAAFEPGDDTITFAIDDEADVLDCTFTNRARGSIIVEKVTSDGSGSFDFTSTTLTPAAFTLTTTQPGQAGKDSETFSDLATGTYDVAETVPGGWNLVSQSCDDGSDPSSIGLSAGETVTCTFTNSRETGAIEITKTRKHAADGPGDHPHAGVTFTVTGGELPAGGVAVVTDGDGIACLDGLVLSSFVGDYTVTETVPAGYSADDGPATVSVTTEASCGDGFEDTASFSNTPLSDLTVSVDSLVDGGTNSTIECELSDDDPDAESGDASGDVSITFEDLEPGTYTCVIFIDP